MTKDDLSPAGLESKYLSTDPSTRVFPLPASKNAFSAPAGFMF